MKEDIYLVNYAPYSNEIQTVRKVLSETACYYRIRIRGDFEVLVRKSNLREKGGTKQWYKMSKQEIDEKIERQKLVDFCIKTYFNGLTTEKLRKIKEIVESK